MHFHETNGNMDLSLSEVLMEDHFFWMYALTPFHCESVSVSWESTIHILQRKLYQWSTKMCLVVFLQSSGHPADIYQLWKPTFI